MKKIAILFPGQGSQYAGMGKELYQESVIARRIFDEASEILGYDIAKLCSEKDDKLDTTEYIQPTVFTYGYASFKVLESMSNTNFSFLAGHSLGEYTALAAAGFMSFQDALPLVYLRGKLMQEVATQNQGGMKAIFGVDAYTIDSVCKEISTEDSFAEISNYNSRSQTVISGDQLAINKVEQKILEQEGSAKVVSLKVNAPFHSRKMLPVAKKMEEALSHIKTNKLRYPVISNITAIPYHSEQNITSMLVQQIRRPVEWYKTMNFLYLNHIDAIVDIGPGEIVKNLMKQTYPNVKAYSFNLVNDECLQYVK